MSRIALLGGSFNPPHLAHQMMCLWALSTRHADSVWLIPCFQHPFSKALEAFDHRVQMCKLATQPFFAGSVSVCEIEKEMPPPSRTFHTIQTLIQTYTEHTFAFMMGSDILADKQAWYRFDDIERMVDILVIGRAGHTSEDITHEASGSAMFQLPAISSTLIRERIARHEGIAHLVPSPVLDYIEAHKLYQHQV